MPAYRTAQAACLWLACSLLAGTVVAAPSPDTLAPHPTGSVIRLGDIELRTDSRTIRFPAEVNLTNQVIEYVLVTEDGKTHESLLRTPARPTDLQVAFLLLGVKPQSESRRTHRPLAVRAGSRVEVGVEWQENGVGRTNQVSDWIGLATGKSGGPVRGAGIPVWAYTGSRVLNGRYLAQEEGSIISLIRDPVAMIVNPGADRDDDDIHFPLTGDVPARGTRVTVVLSMPKAGQGKSTARRTK